jgi:leader peptidase (prepilin peptidase)/N-methyltransferase
VRFASDLVLALILATATLTDLRRRLIPNRLLLAGVLVGLPLLAFADPASLIGRLATMAFAGGFFFLASLVRPDGLGMGDVKLIATMGLFLDGALLEAILIALCTASLFGVALLLRHGRAAMERTLPFAPFLALGGLVALLAGSGSV